jgi:hypothetical protein
LRAGKETGSQQRLSGRILLAIFTDQNSILSNNEIKPD